MTGPRAMLAESLAAAAYDLPQQQDVRYTYWPVSYYLGDPTVIGGASLPLSGVSFSQIMKGVGELRASLQLADPTVREMNPWELILPRKTGIVVVRSVWNPEFQTEDHQAVWHGTVWEATPVPETGRMEITARTVEYNWAQRLITGPMAGGNLVWAQKDRTVIVQDLLTPEKFSQLGPAAILAQAITTATSGANNRVNVATVDAPLFPVGSYLQIIKDDGSFRRSVDGANTVFRVTGQTPVGGGNTWVLLTPLTDDVSLIGETVIRVNLWPGWINVDKPTRMTGRLHDFKYNRDQQTNLLEAHQDRSKVGDGYDWYTSVRTLSGTDAFNASTYRLQYVMGYPRLGREYGVDDIPRFSFYVDGRGNVLRASPVFNGSGVRNAMWGAGAGFDSTQLRALATNSADWANGFLITEGRYSNPDLTRSDTLEEYTKAALIQSYANEKFLKSITVRADHLPYFGTYNIGDDALYTTDDWTNPDRPDGTRDVTYLTRIMGWRVTPPEARNSEKVELVLAGGASEESLG